jgi:hypothetical protein
VTTGKVIWSANQSRTETTNSFSKTKQITLLDFQQKVMHMLQPSNKTAIRMSLSGAPMLEAVAGGSTPVAGNESFAEALKQLKATQGVKVKELGSKKVNGYDCHGLELTVDLSKLGMGPQGPGASRAEGLSGGQGMPNSQMMQSMLGAMGSMTSDVWLSDKYNVPVKTINKTTGMSMVMELTNLAAWSGPDSTFAVPAGYKITDMSAQLKAAGAGHAQ